MNPWKLAIWTMLSFILAAMVCFTLALLVSCSMPALQVDCWQRPKDMPPLTLDVCHGKQVHLTWRF